MMFLYWGRDFFRPNIKRQIRQFGHFSWYKKGYYHHWDFFADAKTCFNTKYLLSATFKTIFYTKAETFVRDQIFWCLWWFFFTDQFSFSQFQDPATHMKFKNHGRDDSKTVVAVASALRWRICPAALARSANRGAALIIFIVDGGSIAMLYIDKRESSRFASGW